jgi:hypothetical protein
MNQFLIRISHFHGLISPQHFLPQLPFFWILREVVKKQRVDKCCLDLELQFEVLVASLTKEINPIFLTAALLPAHIAWI